MKKVITIFTLLLAGVVSAYGTTNGSNESDKEYVELKKGKNSFIEMKASRNVVINKDFNLLKQSTLLINTTADLENYTIVWPLYF
ncbi:MAG: hypothetical protein IIU69_05235 [Bacteroidaceae bacterium]|nr:hypothetical protein [Bacteroidaceae bacterium]